MGVRAVAVCALAVLAAVAQARGEEPVQVYPVKAKGFTASLDGAWAFKYVAGSEAGADAGFVEPGADVSGWKKIAVPGNWEVQGFAEPHYYMDLQEGLGLYRRTFVAPANWREGGRRVCLQFEGVAFGFEAWVNGKKVGESTGSGFNPTTLDVTDALLAEGDNVLAVKVTTKPIAWQSEVNDDWDLSGIFRDVTLFSVPATHVQDLTTRTKVGADGAAELAVNVRVNAADAGVRGKLVAPGGETVKEFDLPRGAEGTYAAVVRVEKPALWTAESPALYRLELTLSAKGLAVQTVEQRVGLREISIVDGVLKLNGRPIKLHGVDRHDEAPEVGRATREGNWVKDLAMMKQGNINFVRTSHSPPNEGFIQKCDEAGIYVLCEVPLAHFQGALKNDPAYRANVMARVEQTIGRDKNHASVIAWSIGNENNYADLLFEAGKHAKEIDPSRPICYPTIGTYFDDNAGKYPAFADIYALHYPTNAMLKHWTETLDRPTILTEYSHANGLATDHIQDQWEMMEAAPHFAGGAIWHFMDQGLLRTSDKPVDRSKPTGTVWVDATHFYDTKGTAGQDGILYADRTPQTDFWETRKVYAPVQIAETAAAVKAGAQEIGLTVENRYDFRSLSGMKLAWSLERNGAAVQQGEIALRAGSHEKERVGVPVTVPADGAGDVLALNVRCLDEKGMAINERGVRLEWPGARLDGWLAALPGGLPKVRDGVDEATIETGAWVLTVSRKTGEATIKDKGGRVLVAGIYPHAGRKLTEPERGRVKKLDMWPASMLRTAEGVEVKLSAEGGGVHVAVSGRYPRPGAPEQAFVGGYEADIAASGAIAVRYSYIPTEAKGSLAEAGLSLMMPAEMTEFRWIGAGPYAGYPGKDRLNEFGLFHLNRDDLRFQGNRRQTRVALLTTPGGAGVAVLTDAADVAVERDGDQALLSCNAVISGLGEKGRTPETLIDAAKTGTVAGSFTLLPLGEAWPETLVRWFGKPAAASEVYRPFYHSYDQ